MEEEFEDDISLIEAQSFMEAIKKEEAKKKEEIKRPEVEEDLEKKLKEAEDEAAKVIDNMNKAEAVFYRDEDSIATIDIETLQNTTKETSQVATAVKNKSTSAARNVGDDQSVASSITIKLLIWKQSKIDARIDRVDDILSKILLHLQSSVVSSQTKNNNSSETRSDITSCKKA